MIKAFHGKHFLEGEFPRGRSTTREWVARQAVSRKGGPQGRGGEEYYLEIDGEERKLGEGFII